MARTVVDIDRGLLDYAQEQLGTASKRETVKLALALAASLAAQDGPSALSWLGQHADLLDLDLVLIGELRSA